MLGFSENQTSCLWPPRLCNGSGAGNGPHPALESALRSTDGECTSCDLPPLGPFRLATLLRPGLGVLLAVG